MDSSDLPGFDRLHTEFRPKLVRYLSRMVGPDAEDLAQEVMLRVHKNLASFEGRSSISTWIYRIATNAALDRLRSFKARKTAAEVSLDGLPPYAKDAFASRAAPAPDVEMLECVQGFIHSLPEDYRTAFVLQEMAELTNSEIAEILDISLSNTKIRIHRARERLRKKMEAGCCLYYDENNLLACSRKA